MQNPTIDEVLGFLRDWKTTQEIRNHFEFSNSNWYRFKLRLRNLNLIIEKNMTGKIKSRRGVLIVYKRRR